MTHHYFTAHNAKRSPLRAWEVARYVDGERQIVHTAPTEHWAKVWAERYNAGQKPATDMTEEEYATYSEQLRAAAAEDRT